MLLSHLLTSSNVIRCLAGTNTAYCTTSANIGELNLPTCVILFFKLSSLFVHIKTKQPNTATHIYMTRAQVHSLIRFNACQFWKPHTNYYFVHDRCQEVWIKFELRKEHQCVIIIVAPSALYGRNQTYCSLLSFVFLARTTKNQ